MNSRKTSPLERELDAMIPGEEIVPVSLTTEQAIRDRLLASLHPVRPLPSRFVLAASFLFIFAAMTALLVAFIGMRGAVGMATSQLSGILAAILIAAGLASFALSSEMTPGQRQFVHPGILTTGILLALLALVGSLFPWADGFTRGWHCFSSGFLFSLPAVALVLLVVRKGAPLSWGAVGASAGLLGGLVGLAAIHVGCSLLSAPHMAVGHITVPLAGALAGYLAGKGLQFWMKPRSREV